MTDINFYCSRRTLFILGRRREAWRSREISRVPRLNKQKDGKQGERKIDSKCGRGTVFPGGFFGSSRRPASQALEYHSDLPSFIHEFHLIFYRYK
jgi:hypothetical protein